MNLCLILGATGRVGSYLARMMETQEIPFIAWNRTQCDMRFPETVEELVAACPADTVVNCAAISSIEACAQNPVEAHYVNAMAPQFLARACAREGKRLVHLSTDYVLDGRRPGLKPETAKCKPVNTYGESKWEAEMRILDEMPEALVARISWVFGNPHKPSFPGMVLQHALAGEPVSVISDKDSIPTWIDDLCRWIINLVLGDMPSGLLHLCQSGSPVTWAEYAQTVLTIAREEGLPIRDLDLHCTKLASHREFSEPRPLHTAMDSNRLATVLGHPIRSWQKAIRLAISQHAQFI